MNILVIILCSVSLRMKRKLLLLLLLLLLLIGFRLCSSGLAIGRATNYSSWMACCSSLAAAVNRTKQSFVLFRHLSGSFRTWPVMLGTTSTIVLYSVFSSFTWNNHCFIHLPSPNWWWQSELANSVHELFIFWQKRTLFSSPRIIL